MANLTLAIDDDLLKQARIRAIEMGTSVNALVRDLLKRVVSGEPVVAAPTDEQTREAEWERFLEAANRARNSPGAIKLDRLPTREEIWSERTDRMLLRSGLDPESGRGL